MVQQKHRYDTERKRWCNKNTDTTQKGRDVAAKTQILHRKEKMVQQKHRHDTERKRCCNKHRYDTERKR